MTKWLTDNWRTLWRAWSVQIAGLLAAYGALPPDMQQSIMAGLTAALAMLGIGSTRIPLVLALVWLLARYLRQGQVGASAD